MKRSNWKGPSIQNIKIKKIKSKKIPIKIFNRNSYITPVCLGSKFLIHNGKSFLPLTVSSEMIGYKFGEFSFTRKQFKFKK